MAVTVDLKKYFNLYGSHNIKVVATGEGFRNSTPVEFIIENKPLVDYQKGVIKVTNILTNILSYDFYIDDVLVKTYEHDKESIEAITIDLSDFDISSGEHSFKFVFITTYGSFETDKAYSSPVLGVSGLYAEPLALTRTDDAVGLGFNISTSTGIVTSDFDDYFPYNEFKEVTDESGNSFISIPEMWFRIGYDDENNITDIAVSRHRKIEGNWVKSDAFLVGKYLSSVENNKMISKTGKSTSTSLSANNWVTYAKSCGTGYKPIGLYEHTILMFLWFIEFANKNSKDIMTGYTSYNKATGGTDSITSTTGFLTSNKQMKYRGIEDFTGNDNLWLPDATANYYVSRDIECYKPGIDYKRRLCYWSDKIKQTSSTWRSILALGWDDNHPFFCLPSKVGTANLSTYFKSNMYGPSDSSNMVTRGKFYSGYGTNTNLTSILFDYSYGSTSDNSISRLVKYENKGE